ncbi:AraC family transcriptional regulator [Anoxybacterium hadale]|uniref:AraC family transcriptional regulator n=1 Tax=Anoxybacterium hadale TaxID=3408580 RepID=A0ACD1A6G1_9FIRM|nr:AraC family transcriptional regulator [Clostridiales bacterium]
MYVHRNGLHQGEAVFFMRDYSFQSKFTEDEIEKTLNHYLSLQPGFDANLTFYREYQPKDKIVSKYVAYFYELHTSASKNVSIPIIPDGCMDLVFVKTDDEYKSYIIGTALKFSGLLAVKNRYVIGIRFHPGALRMFFDVDPFQILAQQIPLGAHMVKNRDINEQLYRAESSQERVTILENLLISNIKRHEKYKIVQYCVQRMVESKGLVNLNTLSDEVHYSTRYLNHLFRDYVGLSPKYLDEIIKLQTTIFLIANSSDSLCDIAFHSGFCDQSHMNRLLKKFLGGPSSTLLNQGFFTADHHVLNNIYIF